MTITLRRRRRRELPAEPSHWSASIAQLRDDIHTLEERAAAYAHNARHYAETAEEWRISAAQTQHPELHAIRRANADRDQAEARQWADATLKARNSAAVLRTELAWMEQQSR